MNCIVSLTSTRIDQEAFSENVGSCAITLLQGWPGGSPRVSGNGYTLTNISGSNFASNAAVQSDLTSTRTWQVEVYTACLKLHLDQPKHLFCVLVGLNMLRYGVLCMV